EQQDRAAICWTRCLLAPIGRDMPSQHARGERGGNAPAVDAERGFVHPANETATRQPTRERRQRAPDPPDPRDVAEHAVAQREAMPVVVLVKKLRLEPRHIDVGGALALAGLALEAEVEHAADVRIGQALEAELTGHRHAQGVRATAGAVAL